MPLKREISEGIKDEEQGYMYYKRLSTSKGLTKEEKARVLDMARDEQRHRSNLINIKQRLYM